MVHGSFALITPLNLQMKLSRLKEICGAIEAKYGDIKICFHPAGECYGVQEPCDCQWNEATPRYLSGEGFPGEAVLEEDSKENGSPNAPAIVFFLD